MTAVTVERPPSPTRTAGPAAPTAGLAVFAVAVLAAVAQAVEAVVVPVRAAAAHHTFGRIGAAVAAVNAVLAVGLLVMAGLTLGSVTTGRRDLAAEVTRALLLSIYTAAVSALSLGAVRTIPTLQWLTALALPVAAGAVWLGSSAVRTRFGEGFPARMGDALLRLLARDAALGVILMLLALVVVLGVSAVPTVRAFGAHFVVGREWRPNPLPGVPVRDAKGTIVYDDDGNQVMTEIPPAFGALPVIYGTAVSSVIALVLAVPLSLGTAVFLVRIAAGWLVGPVSFLVEFLAAIPSIAYGIWGLFVMGPFLRLHVEPALNAVFLHAPGLHFLGLPPGPHGEPPPYSGRDMLAGGVVLGIMVVPIITAIARDVLRNTPRAQLEGTVALGATWWESSKEMLKFSRSGLFGAVMLGLARAAGETMAITMVIGNNNQIRASLLEPAQTMSSLLANEFAEAGGDLQRAALTEVALILLVMSLLFNIVARYLVVGKGSRTAGAH